MDMIMRNTMGNKFGKRFDYNEWIKWWIKLTTSEQTLNYNGIQKLIFIKKNEINILRVDKNNQ